MQELRLETFSPHVGTAFALQADSGLLDLVLATASPGAKDDEPRDRSPFSLEFRGPPKPILPQRIYRLDHAELGSLDIFLVPLGADENGVTYEAVFA